MGKRFQITMAAARVNAGLTQEQVAETMKLSKQTIINWEKGRIMPKPAQFKMFCEVVGVDEDLISLPVR